MRSRLGDITLYGRNPGLIITRPGNKKMGLVIIWEKWNLTAYVVQWRGKLVSYL